MDIRRRGGLGVKWSVRLTVTPPFPRDVLAFGGELKNTVCLGSADEAVISDPHGDLSHPDDYRRFLATVASMEEQLAGGDHVIAHDLHPSYQSTIHAREHAQQRVAVQHHHAHAVSCAVDAGVALPVIGIVCDGAGFGTDGAVWGGEILFCDARSFRRMAHLDYFRLPGGDAAARSTWRPAMSLSREALQEEQASIDSPAFDSIDPTERKLVARQLEVGLNAPETSSLGRLFDAVAFLTGIRAHNEHEGQAAIELQAAAEDQRGDVYDFELERFPKSRAVTPPFHPPLPKGGKREVERYRKTGFALPACDEVSRIDWRPMIRRILDDVRAGVSTATIAAGFHTTVAAMFAAGAKHAVELTRVERVVLSGGCFLNDLLRVQLVERLEALGLEVAVHERVPPGDAGLSLGQAVVASASAAHLQAEST